MNHGHVMKTRLAELGNLPQPKPSFAATIREIVASHVPTLSEIRERFHFPTMQERITDFLNEERRKNAWHQESTPKKPQLASQRINPLNRKTSKLMSERKKLAPHPHELSAEKCNPITPETTSNAVVASMPAVDTTAGAFLCGLCWKKQPHPETGRVALVTHITCSECGRVDCLGFGPVEA